MTETADRPARYLSFLCQSCGFWSDGQVSGNVLFCAQCGAPRQGEVTEAPRPSAPSPGTGVRVLVCEDSTMLRKAMGKMLTSLGCDVREAADGKEGIAALDWDPHVLLTDVDMPGASGIDIVRTLREERRRFDVPIVVLTGRSDAQTVSTMMKWNVMAYLLKEQVGSKELREKLTRCLIASQLLDRRDSTRKVLVAEDSYTYRRAVADMLKLMSCEVIETEDGMQALAIARQQLPDLIISDQQMPHMSGLDLLRQVRSLPGGERLPFVMLTSIGDGKTMAAAMAEGVSAYILKDETDPKSLKRQIQRALTTASAMA